MAKKGKGKGINLAERNRSKNIYKGLKNRRKNKEGREGSGKCGEDMTERLW